MIVAAGALTSCKKAHTCSCQGTTAVMPTPVKSVMTFTDTKKNAKIQCEDHEASQKNVYNQLGGDFNCDFK